mmetsp:Transcript_69073/g.133334  ORF Transcript_69073/g.133334 Transcript_69073/m.133334 type:complete len:426 (-) Transcript_69073:457-1734(-)
MVTAGKPSRCILASIVCFGMFVLPARGSMGVGPSQVEGRCASVNEPKQQRCTGCPPMLNGKLCASTTRYNDQTKAACGCGNSDPVPRDWWTLTKFTAALDCKNLDPQHPLLGWCPKGCGGCYKLCSTGGSMHGHLPKADVCRVFKITNRCGDGFRQYPMWCSNNLSYAECQADPLLCKQMHSTNHYGYPAHFDLQDFHLQVSGGLEWDNVEVTFEPVSCTEWSGPDWNCHCSAIEEASHNTTNANPARSPSPSPWPAPSPRPSPRPTPKPSPSGNHDRSNSTPGANCGKEWEQCGGKDFHGPTCCQTGCYCTDLRKTRGYNPYFTHQCVPSHWAGCSRGAAAVDGSSSLVVMYDALADQKLSIGNRAWGGSLGMVAGMGLSALLMMAIALRLVFVSRTSGHTLLLSSAAEDIEESSGLLDGPSTA